MDHDNLEILKKIKRVDAPVYLYAKINERIKTKSIEIIPLYKVGIAASILFAFFTMQLIIIAQSKNSNNANVSEHTEWVEINNNTFYYE